MKKSRMKERIKKLTDDLNRLEFLLGLEKQQREMTAAKVEKHRLWLNDLEQDVAEIKRRFDPQAAFTKARQCGNNVLAAVAGQPSVTVTATRQEDSTLAKMATLALRMGWPLEPTQADREALYRDGLAHGLTSVEAFERAKMGDEIEVRFAVPEKYRTVRGGGGGCPPDYMRKIEVQVPAMATQALRVAEGDMAGKLAEFLVNSKPSLADKEDLYRDGLAAGFTSEEAWERAKMGVEAWNAKRRAELEKDTAE